MKKSILNFSTARSLILSLVLSSLSFNLLGQNEIENLVSSLIRKENKVSDEEYSKIENAGKEAIPYLINSIDANVKGIVGCQNIYSSTVILALDEFVGIRAAEVIEMILSTLTKRPLFEFCLIFKTTDSRYIRSNFTITDIEKIKKVYDEWWLKNSKLSMLDLQAASIDLHQRLRVAGFEWR